MGLLSSSVSLTRYLVQGSIEGPLLDSVLDGLKKNTIQDIDNDATQKASGWTSFSDPFAPDFETSSCVIGSYLIFSLRIDKKNISSKIIKKKCAVEVSKKKATTGRDFLSRSEKRSIAQNITDALSLRVPATPNIYDVVWDYEKSILWFFSNLKAANEELETLFSASFKLTLVRLFPYTIADLVSDLSDKERDRLTQLSPTTFTDSFG